MTEPIANFVRVIFEGPLPMRAFFECLHCDEPLTVDADRKGWQCTACGTHTPHAALVLHLKQCVVALKGGLDGEGGRVR